MTDLLWARSTMALSLGFHILFASISMVLPFFMALAHYKYLRYGDEVHLRLTKAWSKGAAVLFATGAVSGTALSFQLGLLWPGFMVHAGPIIGMPFSLEGAAFFLEAIFLGLFLYGWDKLSRRLHFYSGVMVGICGLLSGILVISANGWMNSPAGFDWVDGSARNVDPWAAMFNRAWPLQALHMVVAAAQATGFAAAGLHAFGLLRELQARSPQGTAEPSWAADFHRKALGIILPVAVFASLLQPVVGDFAAKSVALRQPEKFAAMEAHFHTDGDASLIVGGIPNERTESVEYAVHIPHALSILAHGDPHAEVIGLDRFPKNERPPVSIVHFAFQIMVGLGMAMVAVSLIWLGTRKWRPSRLDSRRFLRLLVVMTPAGFIALEAGWVVTEVGRQPWIVYRVLRTSEAVTPVPGLEVTFFFILALYAFLGTLSFFVLGRLYVAETRERTSPRGIAEAAL